MEELDFLKELQNELKNQDTDVQASPRFWVIGDYREVTCMEGNEDFNKISIPLRDFLGDRKETIELLKEDEEYLEDLKEWEKTNGNIEDWNVSDLVGYINAEYGYTAYGEEAYLVPITVERYNVPDTFFITKEEAKSHIRLNKHRYTYKVHTYAMTAFRAPKVEKLWDILENFDWDSIKK